MSHYIEPGTPRSAAEIAAVIQEVEDDINSVGAFSYQPGSLIPEVLLSGLVVAHYCAGEVSGSEVELEFVPGDAASAWTTFLIISTGGSGNGYGSGHRDMEAITIYNTPTFGGVVVEWDVSVDRATTWFAPAFTASHAMSRLVIELELDVCNNSAVHIEGNWYRVAGPFYHRLNAVFGTQGVGFPITDADFNLPKGINNPVTGLTFSGAVLLDQATIVEAVGSPTNINVYGVRLRARVWCSDAMYSSMTDSVNGLTPVAVIDVGNSRLFLEHTRTGVLQ